MEAIDRVPLSLLARVLHRRRVLLATVAFTAIVGIMTLQASAMAGTLEIQFSGLNLDYNGTSIFDSAAHNIIGVGDPAQSDPLNTMTFLLDGVQVGTTLTTGIFSDIYLANVLNIPVGGGVVTSGGNGDSFGVDLLTQNLTPGFGLALNVDTMQLFYTGSKIAISVSGVASSLFTQSLPFSLEYDPTQPITIVVSSANLTNVTSAGGFLTGFNAAGTGNLAGTGNVVPEPSSIVLAAFGFTGLAAWGWRRRKR
jgi:hypothetical protein